MSVDSRDFTPLERAQAELRRAQADFLVAVEKQNEAYNRMLDAEHLEQVARMREEMQQANSKEEDNALVED